MDTEPPTRAWGIALTGHSGTPTHCHIPQCFLSFFEKKVLIDHVPPYLKPYPLSLPQYWLHEVIPHSTFWTATCKSSPANAIVPLLLPKEISKRDYNPADFTDYCSSLTCSQSHEYWTEDWPSKLSFSPKGALQMTPFPPAPIETEHRTPIPGFLASCQTL